MEITKAKAKRLVEHWEGHIENHTNLQECKLPQSNCPIHMWFMELKKSLIEGEESEIKNE